MTPDDSQESDRYARFRAAAHLAFCAAAILALAAALIFRAAGLGLFVLVPAFARFRRSVFPFVVVCAGGGCKPSGFETTAALPSGIEGVAVSETPDASSMPKTSAISVSLMAGAFPAWVVWRTASAAEARLIKLDGSTPRSRKSNSGLWSNRAPTPYNVAARCLHKSAQSGHEHSILISFGDGKSPRSGRVTICMTAAESLP